jgi:hypothetical protein
MDKVKLIKRVDKLNLILCITNLILWSGLFISIFLVDYNTEALRRLAMGSTLVVVIDLVSYRSKSDGKIQ